MISDEVTMYCSPALFFKQETEFLTGIHARSVRVQKILFFSQDLIAGCLR